jgi:chemotaxis protein methyltransferase CheR
MIGAGVIKINDTEFVELADLIYKHSGITFTQNKKYLLENRLSKRLNELNFTSFKDYIYFLKYDAKKRDEIVALLNMVTINETYFLRERAQMDHMVKTVIPELMAKGKKHFKIWSAACSSGEEPYSIAILLTEAGLFSKARFDIIAADINTEVINIAKKGEYRTVSFRGVPPTIINKYFDKEGFIYKLKPEIKSKVKFMQANLQDRLVSSKVGRTDFIFCRNVLIYFDVDSKKNVVEMFHRTLNTPGYLYLGHSESLSKITDKYTMKNFGGGIVYLKT